jgi:soluble lytic murein transglycosylase-like protein
MNRSAMSFIVVAVLLGLPLRAAVADIYQYTDDQGVVHFSNVSVGNAKKFKRIPTAPAGEQYTAPAQRPSPQQTAQVSSSNAPSNYIDMIGTACDRHGVDPALVHAIVKVESDFNPYALSRKGAMGLMQLMPQTAVDMNVRNSFNPTENIDGGVKYLRYLIDRYEGNLQLALAAYNSGETAVRKWGTVPPFPETQNYVQRVLKIYNNGIGNSFAASRVTIYVGYSEDGALVLTDDPAKQKNKNLRRSGKNL